MGATYSVGVRVLCHGHAPHEPVVHVIDVDLVSRFLSAYTLYGGDEGFSGCIEDYVDSFVRNVTAYSASHKLTPP